MVEQLFRRSGSRFTGLSADAGKSTKPLAVTKQKTWQAGGTPATLAEGSSSAAGFAHVDAELGKVDQALQSVVANPRRTIADLTAAEHRAKPMVQSLNQQLDALTRQPLGNASLEEVTQLRSQLRALDEKVHRIATNTLALHVPPNATPVTQANLARDFNGTVADALAEAAKLKAGEAKYFLWNGRKLPVFPTRKVSLAQQRAQLDRLVSSHGSLGLTETISAYETQAAKTSRVLSEAMITATSRGTPRSLNELRQLAKGNAKVSSMKNEAYWAGGQVAHRGEARALVEHWLKDHSAQDVTSLIRDQMEGVQRQLFSSVLADVIKSP